MLFQNKITLRYCASGWFYYRNTGWPKSLCSPDDCIVNIKCTETFWSLCILRCTVLQTSNILTVFIWQNQPDAQYLKFISFWNNTVLFQNKINLRYCASGWFYYRYTEWPKSLCSPDDCIVIIRCTETFWSPCILRCTVLQTSNMLTVFGDSQGPICEHYPWTNVHVGPQWASQSRVGQCQGSLNARSICTGINLKFSINFSVKLNEYFCVLTL